MIDQQRLRALLHYNPDTGIFTWLPRPGNVPLTARIAGKQAGGFDPEGYRIIKKREGDTVHNYRAHRLAWLYVYGEFPTQQLDHINRDKDDNRISNLRQVTNIENAKNQKRAKNNTSGYSGVWWRTAKQRWVVNIYSGGIAKQVGSYKRKADAIARRKEVEAAHGYTSCLA